MRASVERFDRFPRFYEHAPCRSFSDIWQVWDPSLSGRGPEFAPSNSRPSGWTRWRAPQRLTSSSHDRRKRPSWTSVERTGTTRDLRPMFARAHQEKVGFFTSNPVRRCRMPMARWARFTGRRKARQRA